MMRCAPHSVQLRDLEGESFAAGQRVELSLFTRGNGQALGYNLMPVE